MADKTQRRKMFFLLGSLILLLRNKHDTVSRLLLLPQPLSASFEWQSLHQYHTSHTSTISEAASSSSVSKLAHTAKKGLTKTAAALTLTECHLTHLGRSVPYGFEFQGLGHRVFLLPEVERGVLDLLDCMQEEGAVFVAPTDNETSIDITRDVAQVGGKGCSVQAVLVSQGPRFSIILSSFSVCAAPRSSLLLLPSPSLSDTHTSLSPGTGYCGSRCCCIPGRQWGTGSEDSSTGGQVCGRTENQAAGEGGRKGGRQNGHYDRCCMPCQTAFILLLYRLTQSCVELIWIAN